MILNSKDVYFFVPKTGVTEEIKKEYSKEVDEFNENFYKIFKDFRVPATKENSEFLINAGNSTLAGIKIKGHEFYKKEWMRIQGDFYYPNKHKMSNDRWSIIRKATTIKIPSQMAFNLKILGVDKVKKEYDSDAHLFRVVLDTRDGSFVRCSRSFFKTYIENIPKDFKLAGVDEVVVRTHDSEVDEYFRMANPQEIGEGGKHPMDTYGISIEELNGTYFLDMFSEIVHGFRITVDSEGKVHEVAARSGKRELNTPKLRVASILKKIEYKIERKNCIIEYIGGDSDDLKVTEYDPEILLKKENDVSEKEKVVVSKVSDEITPIISNKTEVNAGLSIEGDVGQLIDVDANTDDSGKSEVVAEEPVNDNVEEGKVDS